MSVQPWRWAFLYASRRLQLDLIEQGKTADARNLGNVASAIEQMATDNGHALTSAAKLAPLARTSEAAVRHTLGRFARAGLAHAHRAGGYQLATTPDDYRADEWPTLQPEAVAA